MPLQKHELFTRSKCPNCLPRGHSPGRPGRTQLGDRGSPSPGYSNWPGQRLEKQLRGSWWAVPGPRASRRLQPARSSLCRDASEITPSAGRTEPWGRGIPGEWGPELWASSLARRHPGDTGAPSSRHHACVDSCEPSGEVPRRPRRPGRGERGSQAGLAPRMPPPGGLPAGRGPRATLNGDQSRPAEASGTERPGRRGPKRPSPPPAAPPPCPGRSKQETQDLTWSDPDFWPGFPLSR